MYAQEHYSVCARCGGSIFSQSSRFCTKCGFSLVGVKLEARELQKSVWDRATRQRKFLLQDINLVIKPGEFVGVLGASGSGKSTLVDALSGRRPVNGLVLYNGIDLYRSSGLLKSTIGYVPQQDIVHRKITVERALRYTALLRLPVATSPSAIDQRIKLVLRRVELADKLRQSIDTPVPLSGGQLKRVNLATELVSDPKMLFLDEPTSGLDPGIEEGLMRLFALLASDGRTVICVTHTLNEIEICGLIAVLHAGVLVFFGPPNELCRYFRLRRATDVYKTLASYTPERLAERYQKSELYDEFVTRRRQETATHAVPAVPSIHVGGTSSDRSLLDWRQAMILTRRYIDLMVADKRTLALLLLQAPIIGLIMGLVFNPSGSLAERFRIDRQVMFTMVMSAVWLGCLNSAREVVKELPIYLRERAVNLDVGSYLMSKLLPLSGLCAVQCITLLAIASYMVPISGSILERGTVLFFTALAASSMGLMVSSLVSSADKAIATIPLLLIPQMILSDVSIKLEQVSRIVAKTSIIAFWSFNAIKATLPEDVRACPPDWSTGNFWHGVGMLTVFFVVFLGGATFGLKLKDRHAFRPPPSPLMQGLKAAIVVSLPVIAFLFLSFGPERQRLADFWQDLILSRSTESVAATPAIEPTAASSIEMASPGEGTSAMPGEGQEFGAAVVPASQPWSATSIRVSAGDTISISAMGAIYVGRLKYASPLGQPWSACSSGGLGGPFPAPGLPCWSLIGRIGELGVPFEVGSSVTLKAQTSGTLYLGVNDNYFPDNRGAWNASIILNRAN